MNLTGEFTTVATATALTGLRDQGRLAKVEGLSGVEIRSDDTIRATFRAVTPLGAIPLATTIVVDSVDEHGARLRVCGRRGAQSVDVDLRLTFEDADGNGTKVAWSADLRLGGAGASVGQRVARDVATRAIADVLQAAADQA